jgi:hypothetical protein
MEFNKETVSKIALNAKMAQDVWSNFAHNEKLCECFHLRPTKSGITLISTSDRATTGEPRQQRKGKGALHVRFWNNLTHADVNFLPKQNRRKSPHRFRQIFIIFRKDVDNSP